MKTKIVVATIKPWNIKNARKFKKRYKKRYEVIIIDKKEDLSYEKLRIIDPRYIFIPHWSWMIPKDVYGGFECVVFHITDLPYGRGGSPLQNLILKGFKKTVISALQVNGGIDAGPIYLKIPLDLAGSAEQIYRRASNLIYGKIIPHILKNRPCPVPQKGPVTCFRRRKPGESRVPGKAGIQKLYDHIRMLDAPGYPPAFLEKGKLRFEFSKAIMNDDYLTASVRIIRKGESS